MKKRLVSAVMAVVLSAAMLVGCGGSSGAQQAAGTAEEKTEETAEAEAPQNGGETVKIICGYGAGGTADLVARTYAKTANTLQSDYNFVVENMTRQRPSSPKKIPEPKISWYSVTDSATDMTSASSTRPRKSTSTEQL